MPITGITGEKKNNYYMKCRNLGNDQSAETGLILLRIKQNKNTFMGRMEKVMIPK